ncbi:hypothetical protein [Brevundimonas olei]|uniref:hypothetical protein n=1 Tax=Brevundimonas olei TaxID=657642 RepID=UPI0031D99D23
MNAQKTRPLFDAIDAVYSDEALGKIDEKLNKSKSKIDYEAIAKAIEDNIGSSYIEIDKVLVDDYQRHTDEAEAKLAMNAVMKIVQNFNIKAFRSAMIGQTESGECYALDGVHRLIVAKLVGAKKIAAEIVQIEDAREAATIFDHVNSGRRAVSPHSKSRAKAIIDPKSVDATLVQILSGHGLRIANDDISAVSLSTKFIKNVGDVDFDNGVTMHREIWPDGQVRSEVVCALVTVFKAGDFEDDSDRYKALLNVVRENYQYPLHLMNAVTVKGSGHRHGANRVQAMAEQIVKLFNEGREKEDQIKIKRSALAQPKPKPKKVAKAA